MRFVSISALIFTVFAGGPHAAAQVTPQGLNQVVEQKEGPEKAPPAEDPDLDPITAKINSLEVEQRLSQLMVVTLGGTQRPDNSDRYLLKDLTPGAVIVPRISRPTNAIEYIKALRGTRMERETGIPLFIGANIHALTDHGLLKEEQFIQIPTLLSLAAANDSAATERYADLTARYLSVMGFNMHWGPSLALAPSLPAAKGSLNHFGADPEFAGQTARTLLDVLLDKNILMAAMGFPGGGNNRLGQEPAVLLTPRETLREHDLLPFVQAIESGAKVIHVGNTLVPSLDRRRPASLSPAVLRSLLRTDLGYEGIIVAGPVDSPDLREKYKPAEAAQLAFEAGADMVYWGQSGKLILGAVVQMAKAIRSDQMNADLIDSALRRVITVKEQAGLADLPLPDEKEARKLESDKEKDRIDAAYYIERRALTLVQNRDDVLPLKEDTSAPVGVTGVTGVDELHEALEEYIEPIGKEPMSMARHVTRVHDFELERVTRRARGLKTAVCVFSNKIAARGQKELIRRFHDLGARVVVVLLGYPEHLAEFREADAILLAYTEGRHTAQTMKAVADALAGRAAIQILEAKRDLEARPGESIAFDIRDVVRAPAGVLPDTIEDPFETGYSVSYNPETAVDKVLWEFGDGEKSKEHRSLHAFKAPGRYPVMLTVTDHMDQTVSGQFHVVVK